MYVTLWVTGLNYFQSFSEKVKKTTDPDKKKMQEGQISRLSAALAVVTKAVEGGDGAAAEAAKEDLLSAAKDLISGWLDEREGANVTDNAIFSALPKYWEAKFHEDMEALNVRNLNPNINRKNTNGEAIFRHLFTLVTLGQCYILLAIHIDWYW